MTSFYWVDTEEKASADAAYKGFESDKWIFCETQAELKEVDINDYDGIYLKTGVIELEAEFSAIIRRNKPQWSC